MERIVFLKAHVEGYSRRDGTSVRSYDNRRRAAPAPVHPTQTPAFKRWFGASKCVDEHGKPLVAFHGTTSDFQAFDTRRPRPEGANRRWLGDLGAWFAAPSLYQGNYDEENAEYVAGSFTEKPWREQSGDDDYRDGAHIIPAYLSVQNPLEFEDDEDGTGYLELARMVHRGGGAAAFREKLRADGHDGVVIRNSMTDGSVDRDDWVIFEPTQAKSIHNEGTFDPEDPSLVKALQSGERWITVHPNGPGSDGHAVLIQPQKDGSFKVVGGAGGSLNHMRLTGVKSPGEYAQTMRERAAERRDRSRERVKRDKANGVHQAKAEQHAKVDEKRRAVRRQFVQDVAAKMGWEPDALKLPAEAVEGKDDKVVAKLHAAHERDLLERAKAAVGLNKDRLLADASARAEAELGEVPLDSQNPDVLSVQDMDPVRLESAGLGFAPHYGERADARGADEGEIKDEAEALKEPLSAEQRKAAAARGETAKLVRQNLEAIRDPEETAKLAPKLVEAKQAVDLLKLEKKLRLAEKQAAKAHKDIDKAESEPAKALVLDASDDEIDKAVKDEIEADLRTLSTRTFLSEVEKAAPNARATLGKHIGSGAYNSVNALALAAGGDALVDRSVVDVLGIGGAAEVLARRLKSDLGEDEYRHVQEGMQDFHLNHYMEASKEAIGRANELRETAKEIELGAAENADDLVALQEANRRRGDAIRESQKVLGTALGEMEANAALVYALQRGRSDKPFTTNLGQVSTEAAIRQLRAIGLERGEYTIENAAGNRVLQVTPEGLDRLAKPVNRADLLQVKRNLEIITGEDDEDGWLPDGLADRPDLDLQLKPGVAPQMAEPFEPGAELETGVRAYIGGRTADGDAPADILADLQSADFIQRIGFERAGEYRAVLDKLAPLQDETGKLHQAESLRPAFEAMADTFVQERYGAERTPLHKQDIPVDDTSVEALHRALADEPTGVAAYKPIGELTPHDQRALREFWAKNVARETPDAQGTRRELEQLVANEPERETEDMFGDRVVNPEWSDWRSRRDELRSRINAGSMTWARYVEGMHGPEKAYAAAQDLVRSRVGKAFHDTYNRLNPSKPLRLGAAVIRENLNHLDAVDPAAREARLAQERGLVDSLRNRVGGRYASGSVRDKLDVAREDEAGLQAAQMGLFGEAEPKAAAERKLGPDERYTLGQVAERRLAEIMPGVGRNFQPGQPVKLFRPTLSGGKNWPRQRAIKLLDANKRVVLSFGTGSGKTLIGLGGFTNLHGKGKVKRGLFLAPSIAQGNFGGDALRFLKPGKFQWHCKPGADREERIAAYKDPANHFCVMTHQAFRDDMVHLGAGHAGVSEAEMADKLADMGRPERREWLRGVMRREGINFDYLNLDEGQNALNRKGKENSTLANVIDAMGDHASYYVNASADPVKNDVSEAFSLLQKMDPERYTDQSEFMRKYGVDTLAAKDGLRRELARFQYPSKIDPDITATRREESVPLSEGQRKAVEAVDKAAGDARLARMQGKVDVAAMKTLSPSSFADAAGDQHEEIARELQKNIGLLKPAAMRRAIYEHPESSSHDPLVRKARERPGKQGVVFAHSLAAVHAIAARLQGEGFRVGTITGKDSAKDKARRIAEFTPQAGEPTVDIMVASDAGATGANLQSGQWLVNYDTPDTAMTHAQRNGRINRIGQTQNVELDDLVPDHPEIARARKRLTDKYALRELLTTPMESLDETGVAYFLRQRQIAAETGQGGLF